MQLRGKGGPRLSSWSQQSKQRYNLLTYVRDFTQYARPWKKTFLYYCDRKQQKQRLLIKTTHPVVYMYRLLCVFISQYSNKVDIISMSEAQMGPRGHSQTGEARLLSSACIRHCLADHKHFSHVGSFTTLISWAVDTYLSVLLRRPKYTTSSQQAW